MKSLFVKARPPTVFSDWFAALDINAVRVAQSVALVAQMPLVLFMNVVSSILFASALSDSRPLWTRVAAVLIIWSLLLPIFSSWRRLRLRPDPTTVSRRRIIAIVRHSVLLGITWAGIVVYFLPGEPDSLFSLAVASMGFLCVGAAAILSTIPLACLGYGFPMLVASIYVTVVSNVPTRFLLLQVLALMAFGVVWVAVRGWAPMREIIALKFENASLIANLQREVNRFQALAELSSDWYWEQDSNFRFVADFSRERSRYPATRSSIIGKTRWENESDRNSPFWQEHIADLRAHRDFTDFEYQVKIDDGSYRWVSICGEPRFDTAGRLTGYHGVGKDVTERKTTEAEIRQLAYFDPLTSLPNRRFLMDRLVEINASGRRSGQTSALLFLDLDHFKDVNDARGHLVGDELLKSIAHLLQQLLRVEDFAARMGGDEFILVSGNLGTDPRQAAANAAILAERIRSALTRAVVIDGHSYFVGCSIGITLFPKADHTVDDLLREADTAMYRAKANGRNQTAFFEASMHAALQARFLMASELALAQQRDQLDLHFQPQCDREGRVLGGEMLLRWTHPQYGAVPPMSFIPAAEESGLIIALGNWVLRRACLASLQFESAGFAIPVSINVSPKQFAQAGFVDAVRKTLASTGANAGNLIFEVTENLLIAEFDATVGRMQELALLGVRFSIDDFGTGYSSLAYLRRLPLYELKIDRTFVQDIPHDPGAVAIVLAMLSMAKHLHLRVVAEGVETLEQAAFLQAAGCDCSQGYLFGKPGPVREWLDRMRMHDTLLLAVSK